MRAFRYSFLLFVVLSASAAFSQCTDHDYVTSFDLPTPWVGGTRPTGHVTVHKSICQPDHDVLLTFGYYVYATCSYNTGTSCAVPRGSSTVDLTITAGPRTSDTNTTWFVQASYSGDPGIYQPVTILAPNTCMQTDRNVVIANARDTVTGTVSVSPVLVDQFAVNLSTDHGGLSLPSSVTILANAGSQTFQFSGGYPSTVTITPSPKPTCTATVTVVPDPFRADMPCPDCAQGGHPINLTNGNVWIEQQDYSLPGLGGGVQVNRTWNSLWYTSGSSGFMNGIFGHSWKSTYEERLESLTGGSKKYWKSNGSSWLFSYNSITQAYSLASPADERANLTYSSSTGRFTLWLRDGSQKLFDSSGYLVAIIDRNGNQTSITLNAGRVFAVTDAGGHTLTFSYSAPYSAYLVSTIQDSTGVVATYTYDSQLRPTKVAYADGSAINYAYNTNHLITSVTDVDGKVLETHTYDGERRGLTSVRANGVDAVTVSYTSATTTRVTDSLGNYTDYSFTPVGTSHIRNYVTGVNGPGCASCGLRNNTSFGYDSGLNKNHVVDANGNATDYVFDTMGNVLSKTQHLDAQTPVTWSYTYNSFNQVLTATDPLGVVTKNEYDVKGNLTCTSPDAASTTCSNAAIKTKFAYNSLGQLTQITDPRDTTGAPMKTNIAYYASGNGAGMISTITDAQSKVTTYAYDARNNRTSVADPVNGSSNPTTFTYDAVNRLKKITYPAVSPNPATHTDLTYDTRGRRTTVTDANGKVTNYAYDDADRLTQVTDAQSPTAGVTKYAYDNENNLTKITDALLRDTQFHYDALGHVTQTQFPSGLTEDYTYDQLGNLKTKTDRKRNQTTYNYDALDRLSSKVYNDSTEVDYTYDLAGRLTNVSGSAANGTYGLSYDNLGRLTQTDSTYSFLPAKTWTVQYGYDAASNRSSMTDPQSASTTYVYDTLNRLQTLTSPAGSFGFAYDALGRRTQMTRPNGVNTNYSYDNLSRLLSVLHQVGTSTPLDGATYTYDNAGNRLSKTDNRTSTTSNYGYDNIYQLTSATGGSSEAYTYDLVGNRLTSTGVPNYTVNSSNQLTSTSNATYTYDSDGNTLTKVDSTGTTSYTWDFENRLTSVTLPASGGTVSFVYDPFGRRSKKSSSGATSVYVYDGADQLQEVDSAGTTVVARYTMGPGIDQPMAETRSSTTSFYQADGLGSVTSFTDSTAAIANTYTYDSFGNQTASTGTVVSPFRYAARELDTETGLMYYRARYYDQSSGRFLSGDPLKFKGGINLYEYVRNNPINFVDARGLSPKPVPWSRARTRECYSDEYAECSRRCSPDGVDSCKVSQTFRVMRFKDGLTAWAWVDGPMSCSCNRKEECFKASVPDPKEVKNFQRLMIGLGILGGLAAAPEATIPELPELIPAFAF